MIAVHPADVNILALLNACATGHEVVPGATWRDLDRLAPGATVVVLALGPRPDRLEQLRRFRRRHPHTPVLGVASAGNDQPHASLRYHARDLDELELAELAHASRGQPAVQAKLTAMLIADPLESIAAGIGRRTDLPAKLREGLAACLRRSVPVLSVKRLARACRFKREKLYGSWKRNLGGGITPRAFVEMVALVRAICQMRRTPSACGQRPCWIYAQRLGRWARRQLRPHARNPRPRAWVGDESRAPTSPSRTPIFGCACSEWKLQRLEAAFHHPARDDQGLTVA